MQLTAETYLFSQGRMEGEPLSGQDIASQQVFIDKMNGLRKNGVVILMSCHEPYLIDAISDCLYQLDEGSLTLANQRNIKEKTWYVLKFTNGDQCYVPEQWKGRLQYVENGCVLRVEEKDCNIASMEMLQAGWNLRGMMNESDLCFLFVIMAWIGKTIQGVEPEVSEQVMILRLKSLERFCWGRTVNVRMFVYWRDGRRIVSYTGHEKQKRGNGIDIFDYSVGSLPKRCDREICLYEVYPLVGTANFRCGKLVYQ